MRSGTLYIFYLEYTSSLRTWAHTLKHIKNTLCFGRKKIEDNPWKKNFFEFLNIFNFCFFVVVVKGGNILQYIFNSKKVYFCEIRLKQSRLMSSVPYNFQRSFFLKITTLVTWLKSTLLLKNKCFDTHIYMKTECSQTNKMQHSFECLRSGVG